MLFRMTHPAVDVCIVCSDFEKSLRFYRDMLELEVVVDIMIPGEFATAIGLAPTGFRQVRLEAGHTRIKLMEIDNPPAPRPDTFSPGVRWLTFIIEDVQETVARLKAKGVEFLSEPAVAPDAVGVVCTKDPDGILIEFVQP